jgi:cobalt-zinc-cadmium efflux system membrane fusion protein
MTRWSTVSLGLVATLAAAGGCRGRAEPHPRDEHAAGGAARAQAGGPPSAASGHGHGHADGDAASSPAGAVRSDLDRPVPELFAARCEHDRPAHACDECRYEVGVVKVPPRLLEAGLLRAARAERRRVDAPITLTGEVRLDERRVAHVSPRVEGAVRRVHAALGEAVERGQPLVELESVELGEAESEHLAAQAALRVARANHDRQERLRREGISSEREHLASRQELETAQIRARGAAEKLGRLGLGDAEVRRLAPGRGAGSGGLVVRAPAGGVVLEMHAVAGELVKPEESIVTVGDLSSVWVWADLHEDQLGRVLEAQGAARLRAEVAVKAFPDAAFPGTVDFVGPTMDERTRTVKVRIAAANPGARLRAGMFATVRIFLPGAEEVLAVPGSALLSDEGRSFVFVRHDAEYWVRRPVEPGRRWGGWVAVKGGLAGGETLAGEGSFLLKSDVLRSKMGAGCAD